MSCWQVCQHPAWFAAHIGPQEVPTNISGWVEEGGRLGRAFSSQDAHPPSWAPHAGKEAQGWGWGGGGAGQAEGPCRTVCSWVGWGGGWGNWYGHWAGPSPGPRHSTAACLPPPDGPEQTDPRAGLRTQLLGLLGSAAASAPT